MSRKPARQRSGAYAFIPACAFDDNQMTLRLLATFGCIATYSNAKQNRWCYPEQGTIAARLGIARETVSRHVKRLVELGYLEVRPDYRADGGRTSNMYRLVMDFDLPASRYRVPLDEIEESSDLEDTPPVTMEASPVTPRNHIPPPPVTPEDHMDVTPEDHMDVTPEDHMDVTPEDHSSERPHLTNHLTNQRTRVSPIQKPKQADPEPEARAGTTWGEMWNWGERQHVPPRASDRIKAWNAAHPDRIWGIAPDRIVEGSLA